MSQDTQGTRLQARFGPRFAAIATVVFALAAFFVPGSDAVMVAAGTLGGFENEGNLVVDDAANKDWANAPSVVPIMDDTTDSGFQGSSKELKPSEWLCNSGGASPGKGNLLRAYLSTIELNDSQGFLNLAWVRKSAEGQGDVHVNYEFNQGGTPGPSATSGPCPVKRTAGDLLVTYDFPGGGSQSHINLYRWVPLATPTSAADGDWVDTNLPASAARASVNTAPVTDPIAGGTIEALRFGEATVDLTTALAAAGITDCLHFGVANIRSRSSGESWTSALQDNLPGLPANINTCPTVPEISTTATGQVIAGNPIGDVAHLSGGDDPTGAITFKAFGPNDPNCSRTPAFVSAPVVVNGNGDYASPSFANAPPGTYRWIAYYVSNNLNKNESVSGACNDAGETTVVIDPNPEVALDKKVNGGDHQAPADALMVYVGDALDYAVEITNEGNVPLTISDLADSLHANLGGDCDHGNGYVLPVGGTISCAYSTTAADFAHNVASVKGTPAVGPVVTAADGTFVDGIDPSISVVKSGAHMAHQGDTITYMFEVTNTGDVTLTNVSVDDDKLGHIGDIASLGAGDTEVLFKQSSAPASDLRNVATACGDDPLDKPLCDDDDHFLDVIDPAIEIVKSGTAVAHEGDATDYSFAVTNTGDVTLTNVSVDDVPLGHIGDIASLGAGDSETLTFSSTAPDDDLTNVATACGDDPLHESVCDDDDHVLDVIHPDVEIVKTGALKAEEGDALTYTFVVTNTGDVTLTNVAVDDDKLGHIGDIASLGAGDSQTLTKAYTAPASDVRNVAEVCGTDPLDEQVCDDDDHELDVIHPGIEIVKSGTAQAHEGDDTDYTFIVTNTGDVTLTDVSVDDVPLGHIGDIASLGAGDSETLTFSSTAPDDDLTNVSTACGTNPLNKPLCDDDDHFLDVIHPDIEIVKSGTAKAHEGDATSYSFEVTNTGDVTLTNISVDDAPLGHIGDIASLGADDSETLTFSSTAPDDDLTNVATACGDDPLDESVCDDDDHTLDVIHPAIEIVKSAEARAEEGDDVTYTFEVTNTGDVDLTNVSVDDDKLGHIGDIATLDVGEAETLTKTVAAPANDVRNVATACGDDPLDEQVCDDDDHELDIVHPGIDVEKSGDSLAHEGDEVTYTFDVTNTGDVPLTAVLVTDDILGSIGTIANLAPGATTELEKVYEVPPSTEDVTNIVTACGAGPLAAKQFCDTDEHHLDVIHPAITLDKKLAGADHKPIADALLAHQGDALGYTLLITNTGDTPLDITALEDSLEADVEDSCSGGIGDTLAVGAVITCTYASAAPSDDVHNVASVTGVDELGGPAGTKSASDETFADVVGPAIEVVKDGPALAHNGDEITYTFKVTNTGDVDLTAVRVTDDVLGDVGTIASLAVGQSKTLSKDYVVPAGVEDVRNIATACGVDPGDVEVCDEDPHTSIVITPDVEVVKTADPESAEPGQTVTYTYEVTNTGNTPLTNIEVNDDKLGLIGVIDTLAPGETVTLSKAVTIAADSPRTNVVTACGVDALDLEVCGTDDATISIVLPITPQGRLPATGFWMLLWVAVSMNLIAAGLAMGRTRMTLNSR